MSSQPAKTPSQCISMSPELKVSVVATTFFPFSDQPTKRIRPENALIHEEVRDNLKPNVVAEVDADGHKWFAVAVLSPYTQGFHVMLVDLSNRYVPDPTHMEDKEGTRIMDVWANTVDFQKSLSGTKSVHVGWNWSPRSYGEAEEKGGFQSLTTKWHPQLWNSEEPNKFVPLDSLGEATRRVIQGNSFNRLFGELVSDTSLQDPILRSFLSMQSVRVDNRGISVLLAKGLSETFRKPEFFPHFIKKIAVDLDNMACDISEATTYLDNSDLDRLIKNAFENSTDGIFPILRQDVTLLPAGDRISKIFALKDKNYPSYFIDRLLRLNFRLKDKKDVSENLRIRKGFGYALVFSEDVGTQNAFMRIMPGFFVEDRGGVVEALGIVLKRVERADGSQDEVLAKKRQMLRAFGEYITSTSSI